MPCGKVGSRDFEHMFHPLTTAMGRNLTVFLEMPASWQVSTTSVTSCRVAQHTVTALYTARSG